MFRFGGLLGEEGERRGLRGVIKEAPLGSRVLVQVSLRHVVGSDRVQLVAWTCSQGEEVMQALEDLVCGRKSGRRMNLEGLRLWSGPQIWIDGGADWPFPEPSPFPEIECRSPDMLVRSLRQTVEIFGNWMGELTRRRPDLEVVFFGFGVNWSLSFLGQCVEDLRL